MGCVGFLIPHARRRGAPCRGCPYCCTCNELGRTRRSPGRGQGPRPDRQGSGRQALPSRSESAASIAPSPTNPTLTSTTSCFVIRVVGRPVEDLLELRGALGRVIVPPVSVGDLAQRALVDAAREPAAAEAAATAEPATEPAAPARCR